MRRGPLRETQKARRHSTVKGSEAIAHVTSADIHFAPGIGIKTRSHDTAIGNVKLRAATNGFTSTDIRIRWQVDHRGKKCRIRGRIF